MVNCPKLSKDFRWFILIKISNEARLKNTLCCPNWLRLKIKLSKVIEILRKKIIVRKFIIIKMFQKLPGM